MSKIIDCFTFYNEIDMLNYRLNLLDSIVDYFILVEATKTFTGQSKKLYYNEQKSLFAQFAHKIIHVIVDDLPFSSPNFELKEQWINEEFQRNAISRGIKDILSISDNDYILITDLDEIPDPDLLEKIKKRQIDISFNSFQMDMYYYSLNNKFSYKWNFAKIISYKKFKEINMSCNQLRHSVAPILVKGGWHLSYFGDADFISNKIKHFSHQELNKEEFTNTAKITERINKGHDLYDRDSNPQKVSIKDNNYPPKSWETFLAKYLME